VLSDLFKIAFPLKS